MIEVKPLSSAIALDMFFLEARSKLLDLAAIVDRVFRGSGADRIADDPRLEKIQQALEILHDAGSSKAERIQKVFSLEYDANWERPSPSMVR